MFFWHTSTPGTGTIVGPYKNRKTGSRDPCGTLAEP